MCCSVVLTIFFWTDVYSTHENLIVTGEAEFPGDFRNGALDYGWDTFDEETKLSKRAIELNNGRAAMLGILGLMVHEKLNEIGMVADLPIIGALQ